MATFHTAEPIPPSVFAMAQAKGLGPFRRTYPPETVPVHKLALLALTLLATGALLTAQTGMFGLTVVGIIALILMTATFTTTALNPTLAARRLHLFANGLVVATTQGPVFTCRWDMLTTNLAVTSYSVNGMHVRTAYSCLLADENRATNRITQLFANPEDWSREIQHAVLAAQLPTIVDSVRAGNPVGFGPLVIGPDGIRSRRGTLPWVQVQSCELRSGKIRIKQVGRLTDWTSIPAKDITNLLVFLAAVHHFRAAAVAGRPAEPVAQQPLDR